MFVAVLTMLVVAQRPTVNVRDLLASGPFGVRTSSRDGTTRTAGTAAAKLQDVPWRTPAGTFVGSCEPFDMDLGTGVITKGSQLHVMAFNQETDTVDVDTTVYAGDYTCKPVDSETLVKYSVKYQTEFGGPSSLPQNRGGHLITLKYMTGTLQFNYPNSTSMQNFFTVLNKECSCGGRWNPKSVRTIARNACPSNQVPTSTNVSDICNVITGQTYYSTMLWHDPEHFMLSEGDFSQTVGWSQLVDKHDVYYYLPESHNQNPTNCGYTLYPKCKPSIDAAVAVCDTCSGPGGVPGPDSLECEACIFESFPKSQDGSALWGACCPCFYFSAAQDKLPWLEVDC